VSETRLRRIFHQFLVMIVQFYEASKTKIAAAAAAAAAVAATADSLARS
jgi:hypothetical protein